jgi:hypothetical protein
MPISSINGVLIEDISAINGVAKASVSHYMGQELAAGVSTSYANPLGSGDRTGLITVSHSGGVFVSTPDLGILVNGVLSDTINWIQTVPIDGSDFIRFDFGSAKVVDEAKYYQELSSTHGTWQWQGSNTEGSGYVNIGSSFTFGGSTISTMAELNGNTTPYRYYQMLGVSGSGDGSGYGYEFEFKVEA